MVKMVVGLEMMGAAGVGVVLEETEKPQPVTAGK
jgi:hypothetical protein